MRALRDGLRPAASAPTLAAVSAEHQRAAPRSAGRRCSSAWPPRRSTCSSSAAGSPAPASPSTPPRRGLRTALVEADDFASGTSSKSSKLVHGGLRYLQQGDVRLVYEALHERQRLRRNAPHLVKLLPFMIPILTKDGLIPRRVARALGSAMWMYDLTGGFRIGKFHKRLEGGRRVRPPADDAPGPPRRRLPLLRRHHRRRPARADARPHGRRARRRRRQPLPGRRARRRTPTGRSTGPTVDTGDGADRRSAPASSSTPPACGPTRCGRWRTAIDPDSIRPAKGVHLTVPWARSATTSPSSSRCAGDKRSLFVVPWGARPDGTFEHTYVGTTDTDYDGPLDDPPCTADDIDYVLRALNDAVTTDVTADDVTGVWAGLRPLVKSATQRPHRRPVPPPPGDDRTGRRRRRHRRQADDVPRDGRGHRRRGARAPRPQGPLSHQAAAAARRRRVPRSRPPARPPPTSAGATARSPPRSRRSSPPTPTLGEPLVAGPARTCGPRRSTPSAGDGDDARRRAARRTRAHLFDRPAPLERRRASPSCSPPSWAGTTTRRARAARRRTAARCRTPSEADADASATAHRSHAMTSRPRRSS